MKETIQNKNISYKTPLDDFDFTSSILNNEIRVIATHKTLDICFARKYSWAVNLSSDKNQQAVNIAVKLCKDIMLSSMYGIAQRYRNTNYIEIGIKPEYIHSAQWDKEKEAWFILNEHNERVYE